MTLKDLQPQICDSLDGFLQELNADVSIGRVRNFHRNQPQPPTAARPPVRHYQTSPSLPYYRSMPQHKAQANQRFRCQKNSLQCRVCKAEGRPYSGHSLLECDYISNAEKRGLTYCHTTEVAENDGQMYEMSAEETHSPDMQDHE